MKKLIDIILSFFELTFKVVLAPKAKVFFYYPQHFNRSAEGTNPFFDPLIETCKKHSVSYLLMEEPDWQTSNPRNPNAIKGDFLFVIMILTRKILNYHKVLSHSDRECKVARVVDALTFGKMRYDRYIIISGSLELVLPNINPGSYVFDMQHGIQYSNHSGWFEPDGNLIEYYRTPYLHWLFWGDGYKNCFASNESNNLQKRVHTVGYPLYDNLYSNTHPCFLSERKHVLISLQFTRDIIIEQLKKDKQLIDYFLDSIKDCNITVFLKHHPRYNNEIDIDDILDKYSFVKLTNEPIYELKSHVFLHVTISSTAAFEYAGYGIPTYFLNCGGELLQSNIFYKEYQYPLYNNEKPLEVIHKLKIKTNWEEDSAKTYNWFKCFYTPFDSESFLHLINI